MAHIVLSSSHQTAKGLKAYMFILIRYVMINLVWVSMVVLWLKSREQRHTLCTEVNDFPISLMHSEDTIRKLW